MQKTQNSSETGIEATPLSSKGWTYRGYLPHFDNGKVVQFVTFRLYDSVPEHIINQWKSELNWRKHLTADSEEVIELYKRIELYADTGYGQCFLEDNRISQLIENALLHFDKQRYDLYEWKIMPNHVHIL